MKQVEFKTQDAYFVGSWAKKIDNCIAFNISIDDYGISSKILYSIDGGKSFRKSDKDHLFYDISDAYKALEKEKKSYKEYAEKEIKRYTEIINS